MAFIPRRQARGSGRVRPANCCGSGRDLFGAEQNDGFQPFGKLVEPRRTSNLAKVAGKVLRTGTEKHCALDRRDASHEAKTGPYFRGVCQGAFWRTTGRKGWFGTYYRSLYAQTYQEGAPAGCALGVGDAKRR